MSLFYSLSLLNSLPTQDEITLPRCICTACKVLSYVGGVYVSIDLALIVRKTKLAVSTDNKFLGYS